MFTPMVFSTSTKAKAKAKAKLLPYIPTVDFARESASSQLLVSYLLLKHISHPYQRLEV